MADLEDWSIGPALFKAMSHPLRVQILGVLSNPDVVMSPSQFAEAIGKPTSNVSYHFRELANYDLIEIVAEEKRRGSVEHYYRAKRRTIFNSSPAWARLPGPSRTAVAARALGDYITAAGRSIEGGGFDKRPDSHFSWGTMAVDEEGWNKLQASLSKTLAEMLEIEQESAKRIKGGETGFNVTYGMGGFEAPPTPPDSD